MTEPADPASANHEIVVNTADFGQAPAALIERAASMALATAEVDGAELSITLFGDDDIQRLNREYLNRDRPTDVIAFSLDESDMVIGDVYIGCDQAARQASELGIGLDEELARLAIHGTLHVLGHDHPEGPKRTASDMFLLQERLVRELLAEGES